MKERLKEKIAEYLNVPRKAAEGDENKGLEPRLGVFLVEKGFIRGIEEKKHEWGFIYRSSTRKIYISEKWMPRKKWEYSIFKLGINKETDEEFFPNPGPETKMYRFLHEVNHAYQEYLVCRDLPKSPELWCEKSLQGEVNSHFSSLFNFCFQKREASPEDTGLSVWGNGPHYDYEDADNIPNKMSELAVRAQEDANEFVTMYVWHPEYFRSYLDYLSLQGSSVKDLKKHGLVSLSRKEADYIDGVVRSYVEEMKRVVAKN